MTRWIVLLLLCVGCNGAVDTGQAKAPAGSETREPNESDCKCKPPGTVKTVVLPGGSKWFLDSKGKIIGGESAPEEDGGK